MTHKPGGVLQVNVGMTVSAWALGAAMAADSNSTGMIHRVFRMFQPPSRSPGKDSDTVESPNFTRTIVAYPTVLKRNDLPTPGHYTHRR